MRIWAKICYTWLISLLTGLALANATASHWYVVILVASITAVYLMWSKEKK